jgi:hypothetical protein
MRAQFLQKLIDKFPNDMDLGKAVRLYYWLRQKKHVKTDCEEKVLNPSFRIG